MNASGDKTPRIRVGNAPACSTAPDGRTMIRAGVVFLLAMVGTVATVVISKKLFGASAAHVTFSQAIETTGPSFQKGDTISLGAGSALPSLGASLAQLLGFGPAAPSVTDVTSAPDKDSGYFTLSLNARPFQAAIPDELRAPAARAEIEFDKSLSKRLSALRPKGIAGPQLVDPLVPAESAAPTAARVNQAAPAAAQASSGGHEKLGAPTRKTEQLANLAPGEEGLKEAVVAARNDFRLADATIAKIQRFLDSAPPAGLVALYKPKIAELSEIKRAATRERTSFHLLSDQFEPVSLAREQQNRIRECLARLKGVRGGLIAQKNVTVQPAVTAYVALIDAPGAVDPGSSLQDDVSACLNPLNVQGTVSLMFHFNAPASRALASAMNATAGVFAYSAL